VPVLLGLFDMPLPLEDEPVLLEPVLLGEWELDEPPAALPEDPWAASYSWRLSLPSWSLSSWSKDLLLLLDDDPPEAALLSEDEPELLLCDTDGDLELVLDCFDVSAA